MILTAGLTKPNAQAKAASRRHGHTPEKKALIQREQKNITETKKTEGGGQ